MGRIGTGKAKARKVKTVRKRFSIQQFLVCAYVSTSVIRKKSVEAVSKIAIDPEAQKFGKVLRRYTAGIKNTNLSWCYGNLQRDW